MESDETYFKINAYSSKTKNVINMKVSSEPAYAMNDREAINETEAETRKLLVVLAQAMLDGTLSCFEGASKVIELRHRTGGAQERDEDFDAFAAIQCETGHLPLEMQRHLWSKQALAKFEPEFIKIEEWASAFAPQACENIIARSSSS